MVRLAVFGYTVQHIYFYCECGIPFDEFTEVGGNSRTEKGHRDKRCSSGIYCRHWSDHVLFDALGQSRIRLDIVVIRQ